MLDHQIPPFHLQKIIVRDWPRLSPKLEVGGSSSHTLIASLLIDPQVSKLTLAPHLVIVPDEEQAKALKQTILFLDPHVKVKVLEGFDVSPYSSLYPNPKCSALRMGWLFEAERARAGDIFICDIGSLLQKTLPQEIFVDSTYYLRKGESLLENFSNLLSRLGYYTSPLVEEFGQYAIRGGILDFFSPSMGHPVRVELFGDQIESMRIFDPASSRSISEITEASIVPPREIVLNEEAQGQVLKALRERIKGEEHREEFDGIIQTIRRNEVFRRGEFALAYAYEKLSSPLDFFLEKPHLWLIDPIAMEQTWEEKRSILSKEFEGCAELIAPEPNLLFDSAETLLKQKLYKQFQFYPVKVENPNSETSASIDYFSFHVDELSSASKLGTPEGIESALEKVKNWKKSQYRVFVFASTQSQAERLRLTFERSELTGELVPAESRAWDDWILAQDQDSALIHILTGKHVESVRFPEDKLIFLRDSDFFGRKNRKPSSSSEENQIQTLHYADLKVGDYVVHKDHGVGLFEGLKRIEIQGVPSEFLHLTYRDNDRLYLPVYRIDQLHRYAGPTASVSLDKMGSNVWQKTKIKVRSHLKDVAAELLSIYAQRSQYSREPFPFLEKDYRDFENFFPYDETDDQLRAIEAIHKDFEKERPMDRLVCGDVGFGKTEVAMRAAFRVAHSGKQVCVLAPTTVLTYQHLETFKKRFKGWPLRIEVINRFLSNKQASEVLTGVRNGQVDILIGTHRLLSSDVSFKKLGLLIIDEEQKFGVRHKERLKKLKVGVDTLTLSATPIPRTLNMSLTGLRDLSLITTPPVDRLPTRTFVLKYDPETIRKAIVSEIKRGGQVYFIHNRVQSIYSVLDDLRSIVPDARIRVGHGQMDEEELEKTMLAFFHHEIDVLLCTTIIESGIDNPRANTMFVDQAHQFGLSQLYQLRGRVGRAKERAYCYLLIPSNRVLDRDAKERLKVIQENTALGSGIKVAQYDLELRGAGDLLGEEQSGHIEAVGYELYLELLEEALKEAKGESQAASVEPEINVRIPALIPDEYIGDVRIRLSYYRALASIKSPEDLDRYEDELRDQFGKVPEPVLNLMGLMLIRFICKQLSVRDLSAGVKTISLAFTDQTPLTSEKVLSLVGQANRKYSLTPDSRLIIRMNEITWPRIVDEISYLHRLA